MNKSMSIAAALFAAASLLAAAGLPTSAQAGWGYGNSTPLLNGVAMNGVRLNGPVLQGPPLNGAATGTQPAATRYVAFTLPSGETVPLR